MQNTPTLAKYRIKGFPEFTKPPGKNTKTIHETNDSTVLMGRVLRAMPRPHFTDHIYHPKTLNRLAAQWPTFPYLRPRSTCTAIKLTPVHLFDFMDWGTKDSMCVEIIQASERQNAEEKALAGLLWDVKEQESHVLCESPLAMAMASHLHRGSQWLCQNREAILRTILESPAASYIALSTGFFRKEDEVAAILEKIALDPNLLLGTWQNPVLRRCAEPDWFTKAFRPHPVHQALQHFLVGKSTEAIQLLYASAESNAFAAGISLGLEPQHEKHRRWLKVARGSAEPWYWMAKVWKEGGHDIVLHPHAFMAHANLRHDHPWYYQWLQLAADGQAREGVMELWPSPWSIELLVDRVMPSGLVLDLLRSRSLDPHDSLESAILLWASEYVTQHTS